MPQAYIDAGQLYWYHTATFLKYETDIQHGVSLIPIPTERALDIDTEDDWVQAERISIMFRSF